MEPEKYSVEVLTQMRNAHIARVRKAFDQPESKPETSHPSTEAPKEAKKTAENRLAEILEIWDTNKWNGSEEYWQQLFSERPEAFCLILEGTAYNLRSKCYVGGKSIDNTGGNVLDFLAQYRGNVALVEIKTPKTKLLGSQRYRGNVYAPSGELAGSTVQVLEYRHSLISNFPGLAFQTPGLRAAHPAGVVIIGNLEEEEMNEDQLRSFELYRSSFRDLRIITYNELFDRLRNLVEYLSE
ncbi:Shedu immune nuclease family protein [Streptomyces sp. NPDC001492]